MMFPVGPERMLLTWAHGWSVSRSRPAPVRVLGGVRIDAADRRGAPRYVLPTLDGLPAADLAPGTEVKTLASGAGLRNWTGEGWSMFPDCELMATHFTAGPVELDGPYTAQMSYDSGTVTAAILDRHGTPVSSGRLAPWGRHGIIDQVETRPDHQRRGLATAVMTILGNQAVDCGIRSGLLCATKPGEAVYRRLGWTSHGTVAGAVHAR